MVKLHRVFITNCPQCFGNSSVRFFMHSLAHQFRKLKYILSSSTSESGHNKQHSMMDSSPLIETQTEREENMVVLLHSQIELRT